MVVGDGHDTAGPQAVRKAEIGVGEVSQTGAHEVEEALSPYGCDLRTDTSQVNSQALPTPTHCLGTRWDK